MNTKLTTDAELIPLLERNIPSAWKALFEKYGSAMLGAICKHIPEQDEAEQLLLNSFKRLRELKFVPTTTFLLPYLLRHCIEITKEYCDNNSVSSKDDIDLDFPAIALSLYGSRKTVLESSSPTGAKMVRKTLQADVVRLRRLGNHMSHHAANSAQSI